jgi:hypothetical protein
MTNVMHGHISRPPDGIKYFSTEELTMKMFNSILNYNELRTRILEFDEYFQYTTFYESLVFEFEKAIMKYCSPIKRIKWEASMNIPWIINEIAYDPYSVKMSCIIHDYISAESKKSMRRIMILRDITTPGGEILADKPVFDYSLVDPTGQFENYKWILFETINRDIIKHYYQSYLYYFPITLVEFEKVFFFFMTFSVAKQYPTITDLDDVFSLVKEINEVVRMRYIDLNDILIMSFMNLIQTDPELQKACKNIYEEIIYLNELRSSQVYGCGS